MMVIVGGLKLFLKNVMEIEATQGKSIKKQDYDRFMRSFENSMERWTTEIKFTTRHNCQDIELFTK